MPRLDGFSNCVAVVTGASSGIGEAIARTLAKRGAKVALVARRREKLETLAKEIESSGGQASVYICDVSDRTGVRETTSSILARLGRIDILVNSAGFAQHGLFADESIENVERLMSTNFFSVVHFTSAVMPSMKQQGHGFIVNISSFAGKIGQPDEAAYSASKAAVSAFSEALVHELLPHGIHVLCVHPVLVRTEMFTPEVMARMPVGMEKRFVEPAQFANDVVRALERGEHDVTLPRSYSWIYLLRNLFPNLMRRKMGQVKMARLDIRA